ARAACPADRGAVDLDALRVESRSRPARVGGEKRDEADDEDAHDDHGVDSGKAASGTLSDDCRHLDSSLAGRVRGRAGGHADPWIAGKIPLRSPPARSPPTATDLRARRALHTLVHMLPARRQSTR